MSDDKVIIDQFFENHRPRLSAKTVTSLRPLLSVVHLPKKHVLIRENQLNSKIYLIQKGASRSFYLHNGREVHTWFAFEGDQNQIAAAITEPVMDRIYFAGEALSIKNQAMVHEACESAYRRGATMFWDV